VKGVLGHRPGVTGVRANPVAQTASVTFRSGSHVDRRSAGVCAGVRISLRGAVRSAHVCDPLARAGREVAHDVAAAQRADDADGHAWRRLPLERSAGDLLDDT